MDNQLYPTLSIALPDYYKDFNGYSVRTKLNDLIRKMEPVGSKT